MCQTPISIANRSRRYTEGISQRHFLVPCGHCHECQKRMQDDWFVRSFFEYRRIKKDGSCWFFTLTYTQDNLPLFFDRTYSDPLDEEKFFVRPCFSNVHLKRFRDRLRVYLQRAGYPVSDIRFFISCELGGKFGRPHYHPLLFLPFKIPFKKLWVILLKAWPYGRVGFSSRYGMLVTSDKAVQYCCKYVSKHSSWFRKFGLDDYFYWLVKQAHENPLQYEQKLLDFRRVYRLHFQSMKYGIDGVSCISKDNLKNGIIDLRYFGLDCRKDSPSNMFAVPSYYTRKLLKYKDEYGTDRDTPLAREVKNARFSDLCNSFAERYAPYLDFDSFREHLQPLNLSLDELHDKFSILRDLLAECAFAPSAWALGVYSLVYADTPFARDDTGSWPIPLIGKSIIDLRYKMSPHDCYKYLLSVACDFYVGRSHLERVVPDPEHCSKFDKDKFYFQSETLESFSSLPCFKGFDDFIAEVSRFEVEIGRVLSEANFKKDDDEYNAALVMGILDNKYSYVFNSVLEL